MMMNLYVVVNLDIEFTKQKIQPQKYVNNRLIVEYITSKDLELIYYY